MYHCSNNDISNPESKCLVSGQIKLNPSTTKFCNYLQRNSKERKVPKKGLEQMNEGLLKSNTVLNDLGFKPYHKDQNNKYIDDFKAKTHFKKWSSTFSIER